MDLMLREHRFKRHIEENKKKWFLIIIKRKFSQLQRNIISNLI
jgi:hypothetical protein